MITGFYMMGVFSKGKRPQSHFDRMKPFVIDQQRGEVTARCFRFYKQNVFFDEWEFIENHKISDLNTDLKLRKYCNWIWQDWCQKHKKKYNILLQELDKR